MTTLRTAAQQALEALETPIHEQAFMQRQAAIATLRAALAEPVQEPVAWGCFKDGELQSELVGTKADVDFWVASDEPHMQGMVAGPLYTTLRAALAEPVQRKEHCLWARNGNEPCPHVQQAEPVQEPDYCTWQQDGDSDSGLYATSCRQYFNLEEGTPEDNKLAWCCYCGKKLAQELITEEET